MASWVMGVVSASGYLGIVGLMFLENSRSWGEERVAAFADRYGRWLTASRADVEAAKCWFDRHGGAATFFCRLGPGMRSFISIPAGIARMSLTAFLAYTAAGAGLGTTLLACIGYLIGSQFRQVGDYLDPVSWVMFGMISAVYLYRVARHKGQ